MIEINLLFEELRHKETIKITMPDIPIKKTLYVLTASVLAIQLLFTAYTVYMSVESSIVNADIARLRSAGKEFLDKKTETNAIHDRLRDIRSTTMRKFYWASMLNEVSNSMTKGVWLRTLFVADEEPRSKSAETVKPGKKEKDKDKEETDKKSEDSKYLVLEGSAVGQGQETAFIGKFLKQLKDNALFAELFSDIKPYNINQRRLNDFDVYDFMIYCKFKKDKL